MSDDSLLEDLLDRWEEAQEEGADLSPEQLCQAHPELLPRLKEQIEKLRGVEAGLKRWNAAAGDSDITRGPFELTEASQATEHNIRLNAQFSELEFFRKGGLGAVFRARDDQLHRQVALKFIHHRLAHDEISRQRFLLEAEITGRLQHPGIVAVHCLGATEDGRPFYAMPFLEGETLQAAIEELHQAKSESSGGGVALRRLLTRFVSVCHTIAYAHRRKVVHRDIKPDNIMLGPIR